jgi:hypothetical protein
MVALAKRVGSKPSPFQGKLVDPFHFSLRPPSVCILEQRANIRFAMPRRRTPYSALIFDVFSAYVPSRFHRMLRRAEFYLGREPRSARRDQMRLSQCGKDEAAANGTEIAHSITTARRLGCEFLPLTAEAHSTARKPQEGYEARTGSLPRRGRPTGRIQLVAKQKFLRSGLVGQPALQSHEFGEGRVRPAWGVRGHGLDIAPGVWAWRPIDICID